MPDPSLSTQLAPAPVVHKFGGSSLKDAQGIQVVVQTIQEKVNSGDFVVVSANGPVTDYLMGVMQGQKHIWVILTDYLNQLVATTLNQPKVLREQIEQDLNELSVTVKSGDYNPHQVLAYGELWSAQLLAAKLHEDNITNHWLDARELFVVDTQNNLSNASEARDALRRVSMQQANDTAGIHVVTGFIARDGDGSCITLGRNGSDYSATLMADLLQSPEVYLWTDVDGVYSADPNIIKEAIRLPALTLSEAQALSELGSHVLHQQTIAPILHKRTKIIINSCCNNSAGTHVSRSFAHGINAGKHVKTLALKPALVYLKLAEITELEARQIQTQLTAEQINNYANHFNKIQNTLGFYVEHQDWFKVTQLIKMADLQIAAQQTGISLISAVGQGIRQNSHIISKILNRSAQFTVHQIHYPANDHTLCVLIPDEDAKGLLTHLHQTFFGLEPSIPIVVLGFGNIGQQFLKILKANKSQIEQEIKQSLSVVAVANSRYYQFNEACLLNKTIDLADANDQGQLFKQLKIYTDKPAVIIDLTASEWIANQYLYFAENGWHLISANKLAAANRDYAKSVERTLKQNNRQWRKNTTVGAALPIQETIRQVKAGGDQIKQVSGVFSGSLSWLFGRYDGQTEFMEWIKQAHQNAFTEPDPREDLSGQDVYRKALILAQELGFEPDEVNFKAVIPDEFLSGSIEDFWQNKIGINNYIQSLWQQAQQQGQVLRYLASVSADELRVELSAVDTDHVAAGLKPGDNIFIIESDWYSDNPLVIQGPGAGREVTASGVLTDLIEVLQPGN